MSDQKIRLANLYIEQADIARMQGNLPAAVESFTKAITHYKDLAGEEPAYWSLVADTIEKVGAMYKAAGELLDLAKRWTEESNRLRAMKRGPHETNLLLAESDIFRQCARQLKLAIGER